MLPGHTISLLPPVTLTNLLPHELLYEVGPEKGRIAPGNSADLHNVNVREQLEIVVQLDGYPGTGTVRKPKIRMRVKISNNNILEWLTFRI